jgi:hypothetical protein
MLLIGSTTVSCAVGTVNGNDMKTLTITISITPKGKKILNQAIGRFLGEGSQVPEMKANIVSINVIDGRIGSSGNGCSLVSNKPHHSSIAINIFLIIRPYFLQGLASIKFINIKLLLT